LGSIPRCALVPEGLAVGDQSWVLRCWAGATSRAAFARLPDKQRGCPGASQPPFSPVAGPPLRLTGVPRWSRPPLGTLRGGSAPLWKLLCAGLVQAHEAGLEATSSTWTWQCQAVQALPGSSKEREGSGAEGAAV